MRRKKADGRRKDPERRFISPRLMRVIRWDVAVANRHVKARGDQDKEYVSLHAWGCGCCFIIPARRLIRVWYVTTKHGWIRSGLKGVETGRHVRGPFATVSAANDEARALLRDGQTGIEVVLMENDMVLSHTPFEAPEDKVWHGALANPRDRRRAAP